MSVSGIAISDAGKVLVIQRQDNGLWEPPGGILELNETPEQGVWREILEETGIEIEVVSLSGVYKNMLRSIVGLVFRCRAIGGCLTTGDETRSVDWWTVSHAVHNMVPAQAVRVSDALKPNVAIRAHDGVNLI